MKFSQIPYTRPPLEDTIARLNALISSFQSVESGEEAIRVFLEADLFVEHINSLSAIAYIRYSLDTTDEFYNGEREYFDEIGPLLREPLQRLDSALLESPFRGIMESKFGGQMFRDIEISMRTFDPIVTAELQQENKLTAEYDKLIASAQIPYDDKTLTLAQIAPFMQNPDPEIRRTSCDTRSKWFLERADKLDTLYDDLTKVRTEIAKKLGYKSFTELGYDRMMRNCYDAEKVERFRSGVRKYIVPVAARLKSEQAERIGAEFITVYDDAFEFPTGNAKPYGTPEQIFEHGRKMYRELSAETGEFMDFMLENELFDVLTRPGKSAGGYCADIPDYKSAFIFANFNGTAGDIDVLTHEAGHAFAAYKCRDLKPSSLRNYTNETAEVHSMSMEFFTWPWMDGFFKEPDKYRYSHLASALTFIPYGTMVDEFQHEIYKNPDMTPKNRNELWRSLEAIYRPWLKLDDTPFFEEGRRWQYQGHIYERPFYYIDYCLAQTLALALWALSQEDRPAAWNKYIQFIECAGKMNFADVISFCELPDPFDSAALKTLSDKAVLWLDSQPKFK